MVSQRILVVLLWLCFFGLHAHARKPKVAASMAPSIAAVSVVSNSRMPSSPSQAPSDNSFETFAAGPTPDEIAQRDKDGTFYPGWLPEASPNLKRPGRRAIIASATVTRRQRTRGDMSAKEKADNEKLQTEIRHVAIKRVVETAKAKGETPDEDVLNRVENRYLDAHEIEHKQRQNSLPAGLVRRVTSRIQNEDPLGDTMASVLARAMAAMHGLTFPMINLTALVDHNATAARILVPPPNATQIIQGSSLSTQEKQLVQDALRSVPNFSQPSVNMTQLTAQMQQALDQAKRQRDEKYARRIKRADQFFQRLASGKTTHQDVHGRPKTGPKQAAR